MNNRIDVTLNLVCLHSQCYPSCSRRGEAIYCKFATNPDIVRTLPNFPHPTQLPSSFPGHDEPLLARKGSR